MRERQHHAAAEQADKGEAADSPRCCTCGETTSGFGDMTPGPCYIDEAGFSVHRPAAPVGEPPTCSDCGKPLADNICTVCDVCYKAKARVLVNDEAEAPTETFEDELDAHIAESMKDPEYAEHHHWIEYRETHAIPFWDRHGITEATFKAGFRAARGEDA